MATTISTKDKLKASTVVDDIEDMLAKSPDAGGGGSGNGGIGGGGGSPGGDSPGGGGGGGGGKPGGESFGNNLSFPAIFFETAPTLRGADGSFTFTTPTFLDGFPDTVFFAQGVEGNEWRADYTVAAATEAIAVDYVDLGDALESAPIKAGTNVRIELTLFQDVVNLDEGEPGYVDASTAGETMTGFTMELLGGAKGDGKPDKVGPTESQGAQLAKTEWDSSTPPYTGSTVDSVLDGSTTYEIGLASIYAAETAVSEGEATNAYMSASVQKVTGLTAESTLDELLAALSWDGASGAWEVADGSSATVGANLVNTAFAPELNIAGKYIMGASGKPFKFTSDGNYVLTFALDDGAPLYLDGGTEMTNVAGARETWIVPDGGDGDGHNGLLVMLVGVPSSADSGELLFA